VITLFVVSMFAILIPQVRGMLLEHKKGTIRDIAESVVSILAEYERDVRAGRMDLESAQREAAARIRDIRYGPLRKDYLWITDMLPRMVMHRYRPELDGQDLREFKDASGLPVFVEFVRATSAFGEGYVEYLWQWEDEVDNIVPKLSFVIRFASWDWILGTGVYLDDVNAEISTLTNRIVLVATGVSAILAVFLVFMVQQGHTAEKARQSAESAVRESRERYRVLVEASRQGMAIVMDGAFTFANSALLEMTGYSEHEFLLLSVDDVLIPFPDGTGESDAFLRSMGPGVPLAVSFPPPLTCSLTRKTADRLDAMVTATGFGLGGREGVMLSIQEEGGASRYDSLPEDSRYEAATLEAVADSAARRLTALEPVLGIAVSPAICGPGSTMREAAAEMARLDTDLALVVDDAGRTLGSVSEHALCRHVVAHGTDAGSPLFRVMDAPIPLIGESTSLAGARTRLIESGSD
jgi:PAS domain-containing protein